MEGSEYPSSWITIHLSYLSLDWVSALFFFFSGSCLSALGFPQSQVHSCALLNGFPEKQDFTIKRNCISLLCLLNPFALPTLLNFLERLERPWVYHTRYCGDEKGGETKINI